MEKNDNENLKNSNEDEQAQVRHVLKKSRAAALGLAVFLTMSTALTGCAHNEEDEEDDSYYIGGGHGGSYFFYSGGAYNKSSWGKSYGNVSSSHSYSSGKAGSVGS